MAQEIERKFLVTGPYKPLAVKATRITQGYLSSVPERTVRVRVKGDQGFITVKGIGIKAAPAGLNGKKRFPPRKSFRSWNSANRESLIRPVTW